MKTHIQVTLTTKNNDLGDKLYKYFNTVSNRADLDVLKKEAIDIESSVESLLDSFDACKFWYSISKTYGIEQYEINDTEREYVIDFNEIEYPYAFTFKDQFETWMSAIGCNDAFVDIKLSFSASTNENIFEASEDYSKGKFSIFLGSGVSASLGLPLWGGLLERIASDHYQDGVPERLSSKSLEEQGRWHKRKLGDKYYDCVKNSLYRDIYRLGAPASHLFDVISKMDRVRAICTYNYDDLLEQHDSGRYKSIASACDSYKNNEIPVYHVHGLLPYIGRPKGNLVFSEDEYHGLYNDQQSWANVVQINLLRECTCILIGLSLNDPNLRRILDVIGREKAGSTYIILKMDNVTGTDEKHLTDWVSSKEFDRESYADLNVRTVWVHSYDQIPLVLEECIKNA